MSTAPIRRLLRGALPLLLLAGACAPAPSSRRAAPNVLLVTLDTSRADRFGPRPDATGNVSSITPRFDALARRGVRFENALAIAPLTLPAHCTLMTGLSPAGHGVRDNVGTRLPESRRTLAERFRDAGYRTGGFVSSFVLDRRWGIAQGFDTYFDDFVLPDGTAPDLGAIQRRGDETVARTTEWLGTSDPRPFFAWVHLYDPHAPYAAPEPFRSRFADAPYDGEIAWTDELVGRLSDALDARGFGTSTIVAVIGDHGESLGEHGENDHGYFVYSATLHVPFVLAGPDPALRPGSIVPPVGQADVAPTLLDLAGLGDSRDGGAGESGRSLLPWLRARDASSPLPAVYGESFLPRLHYGFSELRSLRSGRFHFVSAPRPELYDVEADPGELSDLAASERRVLHELRQELADRVAGESAIAAGPAAIDDATRRALAALGYFTPTAGTDVGDPAARADPKDRIALHRDIQHARGLASATGTGESATSRPAAIAALERTVAVDPTVVEAWLALGEIRARAGDTAGAAEAFARALALRPDHVWAAIGLAEALVEENRPDDAVAVFRATAAAVPESVEIHERLGRLLLESGDDRAAAVELARALDLSPGLAEAEVGLATIAFRARDLERAESLLERVLSDSPRARGAHHLRALLLESRGREEEALSEYARELELHPVSPRSAFNRGRLLERRGRPAEAVAAYRTAAEAGVSDARFLLARSLFASGDAAGAAAAAESALAATPRGRYAALGRYVLADVAAARGDRAEAERQAAAGRALEAAASLAPAPGEPERIPRP